MNTPKVHLLHVSTVWCYVLDHVMYMYKNVSMGSMLQKLTVGEYMSHLSSAVVAVASTAMSGTSSALSTSISPSSLITQHNLTGAAVETQKGECAYPQHSPTPPPLQTVTCDIEVLT